MSPAIPMQCATCQLPVHPIPAHFPQYGSGIVFSTHSICTALCFCPPRRKTRSSFSHSCDLCDFVGVGVQVGEYQGAYKVRQSLHESSLLIYQLLSRFHNKGTLSRLKLRMRVCHDNGPSGSSAYLDRWFAWCISLVYHKQDYIHT